MARRMGRTARRGWKRYLCVEGIGYSELFSFNYRAYVPGPGPDRPVAALL